MKKTFKTSKHNKHKSVFVLSLILMVALSSLSLIVVAQAVDFSDCNLWCRIKYLFTGDITGGAALITGAAVGEWTEGTTGLVSYWTFDKDDTSGTTAIDSLGINNGTITGATTGVDGILGEAYSFDGSGDYVDLSSGGFGTLVGRSDCSFAAWVKTKSTSTRQVILADWSAAANLASVIMEVRATGDFGFSIASYPPVDALGGVVTTNWHYVVGTFNDTSNSVTLYVDGEVADTKSQSSQMGAGAHKAIGRGGAWPNVYFNGTLDELGIWSRALSASEVELLYNEGAGLAYPFEAAAVCGNDIVEGTEECDDGNTISGDGCSATCTIEEAGWPEGKTGLVSYWTFDDADTVDSTAVDVHDDNNGTISGATTGVAGILGEAYDFDGSNDYVDCGGDASLKLVGERTIALWVKLSSLGRYHTLYSSQAAGGNWLIVRPANDWGFYVMGLTPYYIYSDITLNAGIWYHLVGRYDGSTLKVFINGVERGTLDVTGSPGIPTLNTFIGRYAGSNIEHTHGIIDEVGIWNRALNSTEVGYLYNNGTGLSYDDFAAPSEGAAEGENCSAKADCSQTPTELFCWGNVVGNYTCNNVAGNSVLPDLVYAPEADSCANCYTGTLYQPNNACVPRWTVSQQYCYQEEKWGEACNPSKPCIGGKYCSNADSLVAPIIS